MMPHSLKLVFLFFLAEVNEGVARSGSSREDVWLLCRCHAVAAKEMLN